MRELYRRRTLIVILLFFGFLFPFAIYAYANDGAADVTPTGIQFKKEDSISIESEKLFLSSSRIEVAYIFKNNSDRDVTTEIAFPIPRYQLITSGFNVIPDFDDFSVEVNGQIIPYEKEMKFTLNGKDYTRLFQQLHISLRNYRIFDADDLVSFKKLDDKSKETLEELGLIDSSGFPLWSEDITYHWRQVFPAGESVIIKHSYKPIQGDMSVRFSTSPNLPPWMSEHRAQLITDACIDKKTLNLLDKNLRKDSPFIHPSWIKYILTTAKSWSGPIKKFHMIIERAENEMISLCFDRKIRRTGEGRFEAKEDDYVPSSDLKIYYFTVGR